MNLETLQSKETLAPKGTETASSFSNLTESSIKALIDDRKQLLQSIKNEIGLKTFYKLEEKIAAEEKRLSEILDWRLGRQKQLAKYTFILDSRFFEQEFLN